MAAPGNSSLRTCQAIQLLVTASLPAGDRNCSHFCMPLSDISISIKEYFYLLQTTGRPVSSPISGCQYPRRPQRVAAVDYQPHPATTASRSSKPQLSATLAYGGEWLRPTTADTKGLQPTVWFGSRRVAGRTHEQVQTCRGMPSRFRKGAEFFVSKYF